MSRETGAHEMNDTTRGELREQVGGELEKYADDYAAWEAGGLEDTGLEDSRQIAAEIIALVTAARDAEIRERLDLIYDEVRCENTDGMGGQDQHTAGYLEGLSVAIGLLTHGDETGGQG